MTIPEMIFTATPDIMVTIEGNAGTFYRMPLNLIFPQMYGDGRLVYVPSSIDIESGKEIPPRMYRVKIEEVIPNEH